MMGAEESRRATARIARDPDWHGVIMLCMACRS